jgi:monofunctional biosynthetic peptidoglycan transglycosylase
MGKKNRGAGKAIKPKKSKSSLFIRIFRFIGKLLLWFFIISVGWVILDRFTPVYYTPLMFIRSVENIADGKSPDFKKEWVSLDEISPNMVNAVVASEDNMFMEHNGFDFKGIEKAFKHNINKKRIRGGSTISQQTAKNVFLYPNRSYVRKGLEAYFTVLIELFWSKERIMEVYLNVIETGDGIYGVEQAAQTYFNKPAKDLTKSEAVYIAVCLPNPRKFSPNKPSPYIKKRKAKVVWVMGKMGGVDLLEK